MPVPATTWSTRATASRTPTCAARGRDTALVDTLDLVDISCESALLPGQEPATSSPAPTGGGGGVGPTASPAVVDTVAPAVSVRLGPGQRLPRALATGIIVRVACSEPCLLTG